VTLRGRLAVAFTTILLAPMVLGAVALAGLSGPDGSLVPLGRSGDDGRARSAVRAVIAARCQHLAATAAGLAATAAAAKQSWAVVPAGATGPWAVCGVDPEVMRGAVPAGIVPTGLAARAEIRTITGEVTGYAYAVQPLDESLFAELSAAADRPVSLAGGVGPEDGDTRTYDLVGPDADVPVALRLEAAPPARDPLPLLLVAIGVALLAAALLGFWLADLATRPLRRLLTTVERASAGDLTARTAVDGSDETGRLGRRLDELIVALQEVQQLSVTDALTGLGNRRHLIETLRVEIERASRFRRCLAVLALDLDHFKLINDRYGHAAGDVVLVEFAARLRRAIREVDRAFRPGGEEFVILLPETDISGSITVAHRIGDAVRRAPFPLGGHGIEKATHVTVSIGIAVFPAHARTASEILNAADQALYAAKAAGRDTYAVFGTRPTLHPTAASTTSAVR
jgi:diguanylate cyclase (GGDEF)-like protein